LAEYFLDPVEKTTLTRLAARGKKSFLNQFWREWQTERSQWQPDREDILRRYNYVNRLYSSNLDKTDGWWTDRGRIYMIYGPCDDEEDVPAPGSGRPYMVWYYYRIRHGVEFVFVDESGGDQYYRLVHSTLEGEIYNQSWYDLLRRPAAERD
jgi:GWxTD domain-containing protein